MGKLIAIVGNCGTGKTTLTQMLCESGPYIALLEQHSERPFQKLFQSELRRYSLSNQMDYLLFRAEQEIFARQNDIIGVQDGGLDQDFHIFTKLFHQKGFLDDNEFHQCERLYLSFRRLLPLPDLFIKLSAPKSILINRRANRKRNLDIVESEDLEKIEFLIQDWMSKMGSVPIIDLDTSNDNPSYENEIDSLVKRIGNVLKLP